MFVGRRPDGSVYGTWTCKQPHDEDHQRIEEVPDDHPDVIAFINRPRPLAGKTIEERVAALEAKIP